MFDVGDSFKTGSVLYMLYDSTMVNQNMSKIHTSAQKC